MSGFKRKKVKGVEGYKTGEGESLENAGEAGEGEAMERPEISGEGPDESDVGGEGTEMGPVTKLELVREGLELLNDKLDRAKYEMKRIKEDFLLAQNKYGNLKDVYSHDIRFFGAKPNAGAIVAEIKERDKENDIKNNEVIMGYKEALVKVEREIALLEMKVQQAQNRVDEVVNEDNGIVMHSKL